MTEVFAWLAFCLQLLPLFLHIIWSGLEKRSLL